VFVLVLGVDLAQWRWLGKAGHGWTCYDEMTLFFFFFLSLSDNYLVGCVWRG
jgi:hypothetical protein